MEYLHQLLDSVPDGRHGAFLLAGTGVVAVLLLALGYKPLRELVDRFRIRWAIRSLGADSMRDVVIPDGMDGYVYIEHLVLTPARLLVVFVKRYGGAIFAGQNMDMWAQVTGNRSYKFPNPLHDVQTAVLAVKSHLPEIDVEGVILFDRDANFPKGKPPGVLHISEIKRNKADRRREIPDAVRGAWSKLLELKTAPG